MPGKASRGQGALGQAGVTIIEVLIASLVVGIAAIGLALMFSTGQAFVNAEGDNRVALFLAHEKIEQLRALGYANLPAPTLATTETVDITPAASAVTQRYSRVWSVDCVNRDNFSSGISCTGGAFPPAKAITVTVQPTPTDAKARAVTLQSVMASR